MEDQGDETEVSVFSTSDTSDTEGESEGIISISTNSKTVGFQLKSQNSFFEVDKR